MLKFVGLNDEIKDYGEYYCKELYAKIDVKVRRVKVVYLDNAMRPFDCPCHLIISQIHDDILASLNLYIVKDIAELARKGTDKEGYLVFHDYIDGLRTFNPFKEEEKQELTRMTARKFVKFVLAGQVKKVICKGRYTDDYYDDAKRNYDKGKEVDIMEFAKNIIESGPKNWKVWFEGDNLTLIQSSWCSYEAEFVV